MKRYKNPLLLMLIILSLLMIKCKTEETEFGFDSAIKGTVTDELGNAIHSDLNTKNIVVILLGDGDQQPTEIRVNGEGTFQNLKVFPKLHKVWLEGPIVYSDTFSIDFSKESNVIQDFVVTPFTTPKITDGEVNGSSLSISYSSIGNDGNEIDKLELYCSTVSYPSVTIGSSTNNWFTKSVVLADQSGTVNVDGLDKGKYYIRIGCQAKNANRMNFSNQTELTIP